MNANGQIIFIDHFKNNNKNTEKFFFFFSTSKSTEKKNLNLGGGTMVVWAVYNQNFKYMKSINQNA